MEADFICNKYVGLYEDLKVILLESQERVVREDADIFFVGNVNFFVKAYMINLCTYLEAYLQDIAYFHSSLISARLKSAGIPHNFVYWKMVKGVGEKDKQLSFKNIQLSVSRDDVAVNLSANPGKTISFFRFLGLNLTASEGFNSTKEVVGTVVGKRNNIIHHNDKAVDISFSDLISYVDIFILYMRAVHGVVVGADCK